LLQVLGNWFLGFIQELGEIFLLMGKCFKALRRGTVHFKNFINQVVHLGIDSLPIVITTAVFVGMVFSIQISKEFSKYGAARVVGGTVGLAIWRELGPVLTAVVIAGRVGSAITAELASMKVTEQIDALKSMAISRTNFLVAPRFFACMLILPGLVALADLFGVLAALIIAKANGINTVAFIASLSTMVVTADLVGGLFKAFLFGVFIAAISCYQGLAASGGAAGVGKATTKSVVVSLIMLFVVNYFLSQFLF